ncbi:MAG: gliding motility-associated C-terminal domain-containing protein, partial [Crocinitomicaceae bacterium]|nr:gliding motility-associated C-terminal domain-containing protein [Crocinitomicaceae bacterium]
ATTTTLTITVNPNVTPTFAAVAPICSGDPLSALPTTSTNGITGTWSPALNNTATTSYTFTPTAGQCAITTSLTITVNPNVTPTFAAVAPICSGDPLSPLPTTSTNGITGTWSPSLNNTATTTYTFTPTAGQCANTTTLTINVNPVFSSTESITQCSGLSYTFPDGVTHTNIVADESYVSVLTSAAGCDSSITTNITVVSGFTISENIFLCSGDDYTYPDGTIHSNIVANESYVSNLISAGGCDSTVTTNLTVNPVYALTENVNVCQNDTYTFPDGSSTVIVANINHLSNLSTLSGCDSIITTQVTMIPLSNSTLSISVCENTAYTFPDGSTQVITIPVTQISTLVSVTGCDSLVTTNITVNPIYQQTQNVTICAGENYTFPDGVTHLNILVDEQYQSNFISV